MKTMAVGHIVHADQAEAIPWEGKAALIAVARELLYSPNWALDAAQKLGADPDFVSVPPAMGWRSGKRAQSAFEGVPSTYQRGVMAEVE
jgi:2,4-dienoyl-CoA reductase-like NADH-dependent reductase (Old Yellow Enzyme family)